MNLNPQSSIPNPTTQSLFAQSLNNHPISRSPNHPMDSLEYTRSTLAPSRHNTSYGTVPIQAAISRPDLNTEGSAMEAANALAVTGPTPGMVARRWLTGFDRCQAWRRLSAAQLFVQR